ncbi:ribosomal protein L7/L12 [Pseudomonas sp. CGJS7]|uniref:ribosomal protein L7/L12 n=1 Tax=Pseudomonas sp. CGJS7 TaxID=3109348 RepID=UPI00300867FB
MPNEKTPFFPPQIATLLKSDNKIQAIKLLIDSNPGMGLREAKDAVEDYERRMRAGDLPVSAVPAAGWSEPAEAGSPQSLGLPEAARVAIQRGELIVAIKIVREVHGLGLREAKDLVEAYAERGEAALVGVVAPASVSAKRGAVGDSGRTVAAGDRSGGLWAAVLLGAIVLAAVWYFIGA